MILVFCAFHIRMKSNEKAHRRKKGSLEISKGENMLYVPFCLNENPAIRRVMYT